MPKLTWVGKDKVVNHHHEVPFRVLKHKYNFKAADSNSQGNKIIHGDNLEALKSLLPEYEGRIKCIYIDPPYNTGNEGWIYNDNVNDEKIKRWLGQVVGKEDEDLSRHDKWLCMMYPRLKLLNKLLADDGSIWVSIDDSEVHSLRFLMDEIFGRNRFIASNVWQKRYSRENRSAIGDVHEYILTYSKNPESFKTRRNLIPLDAEQSKIYKNPNNDPKGRWRGIPMSAQGYRPNQMYQITSPNGKNFLPPEGRCWSLIEPEFRKLEKAGRIYFGKNGDSQPSIIRYLSEVEGLVPWTWWTHNEVGHTDESRKEIREIFGTQTIFDTPKPVRLIERILQIATKPSDLILDSFAGSGTTGQAVLKLNAQDGGNRKFILIETMDYAETITAERVKRVMQGYGENSKAVEGLGGGFNYYEIGDAIFLSDGNLNESIGVDEIRRYVSFTENILAEKQVSQENEHSPYLLGFLEETAYFFIYEPERTTTLNLEFLATLKFRPQASVMYADNCLLSQDELKRFNIIFKKIPRDITRF